MTDFTFIQDCHPERSEGSALRPPFPGRWSLVVDHFPSRAIRVIMYRITTYSPNPARQWYHLSWWVEHGISISPGGLA
jgi:hypothetical protein